MRTLLCLLLFALPVHAQEFNPLQNQIGATVSAYRVMVVTPSDSYEFLQNRAIWVGTGGDLAVVTRGGDRVVIKNVQSGTLLPLQVKQILPVSSGTTATDIQVWW